MHVWNSAKSLGRRPKKVFSHITTARITPIMTFIACVLLGASSVFTARANEVLDVESVTITATIPARCDVQAVAQPRRRGFVVNVRKSCNVPHDTILMYAPDDGSTPFVKRVTGPSKTLSRRLSRQNRVRLTFRIPDRFARPLDPSAVNVAVSVK